MDSRPIGIFDSGIGGLTGLKALRRELPGEDLIFFADTGRMPYGPRPLPELRAIALQDMDFLASFGVKAILSACGTISSAAVRELADYPIPAFGVLHPAVEAMAKIPGKAPLAIIATAASIESGQFTEPLRARCPGREILGIPCPEFAPMIEAGHIEPEDPVLQDAVARALAPLQGRELSALLLGCTHYGVIETAIREALPSVPLLSAAECGASALRDRLGEDGLCAGRAEGGSARFYISSDPEPFDAFASRYLEIGPVRAERLPVMELSI